MAVSDRKHTVPGAGDAPSRATLLAMMLSVNDVVPVANTTERDAAETALSPTTSRPLMVWRADATAGAELELTEDGSTWRTLVQDDASGWVNATLSGPNWTAVTGYTVSYRRIGDVVYIRGMVTYAAGVFTTTIFTLPAGYRPSVKQMYTRFTSSGNGLVSGDLLVETTGTITIPAGYYSGTPVVGTVLPVQGSFVLT